MASDRVILSESCEAGSYASGPRYEGVVTEVSGITLTDVLRSSVFILALNMV